jgi:signal transduction histidine kinase
MIHRLLELDGHTIVVTDPDRRLRRASCRDDTSLAPIQAVERKIRQLLLNLLSNAVKFTPEGGRIEVGAARSESRDIRGRRS